MGRRQHRVAVVLCALLGSQVAFAADQTGSTLLAGPAGLRPTLGTDVPDAAPRRLLLEVWINGHTRGDLVTLVVDRGVFWIRPIELSAAGIDAGEDERAVALSQIGGITFEVDQASQRLLIAAPEERLRPQVLDLRPAVASEDWGDASTGFIFDYDVSLSTDHIGNVTDSGLAGGQFGLTGFTPWGIASTTGFARAGRGDDRFVRLDTYVSVDDPERRRQWTAGDAISGGLSWSRAVRFAGLQLRSDFSLQPEISTLPMPDFAGSTAVPASVDVFVDSTRVFQTDLDGGPFELRNLPVLTGNGDVTVVVRDVLGRETTQSLPIFVTQAMIAQGLFFYTLDAGLLRHNYAEDSFDYQEPVAMATASYGLSDIVTLEGHAEASDELILGGLGAVISIAPFAVVSVAAAHSESRAASGQLYSVSLESRLRPFTLFASWSASDGDYLDLGSIEDFPPPDRLQIGANVNLSPYGSLSASWIEIDRPLDDDSRIGTVSYALSLGDGSYLGVNALYDGETRDWAGEIFLSVAFERPYQASASTEMRDDSYRHRATFDRRIPGETGFGYGVAGEFGDTTRGSAHATWLGTNGEVNGEVAVDSDTVALRAGVSGSIVEIDDSVFMARQTSDAFALVRTGQEGVRVTRENREVARTDEDGELLISNLPAYVPSLIGVEPHDFPMNVVLDSSTRKVAPRRRSVAIVDMGPSPQRPATMTLRLANGEAAPIGASVTFNRLPDTLVVGRHGQLFIPDLRETLQGTADWGEGVCTFAVDPPASAESQGIPDLGPIVCKEPNA